MRLRRLHGLLIGALVFFAPAARAHDPFEAFHSATLHPDRLEFVITMAGATALRLIDAPGSTPTLNAESFGQHRARLLRAARTLFQFTSGRRALVPREAEVVLTEENDIVFRLTYPRPAPGPCAIAATYLRQLGDGYGGIIEVTDPAGRNLGWEQLLWSRPNFTVTIPPATPPKPSP